MPDDPVDDWAIATIANCGLCPATAMPRPAMPVWAFGSTFTCRIDLCPHGTLHAPGIKPLIRVMNPWFKRIFVAVVALELVYLAFGNLALRLPLTQTLLNGLRPDKFEVTWEEAWTFYPFRVHVRGLAANGQSRRQQWQLEMRQGSASMSLLPLAFRHVSLHDVVGEDVLYFQRPRLRPDNDYADTRDFFPPIGNRVLNDAEPLPTGKRPWTVRVANASFLGRHTVWVYQLRAVMEGELQGDFHYRTRGGPFSLRDGRVDLVTDDVVVNGDRHAFEEIVVRGDVEFSEFVPRENKGVDALSFLTMEAELSAAVNSLAFLDVYLRHLDGMRLDGRGLVSGQVNIDRGALRAGTQLDVIAPTLSLEMLDHSASGSGTVQLDVDTDTPGMLDVLVEFSELIARRLGDDRPLLVGSGLLVDASGDADVLSTAAKVRSAQRLAVSIPAVRVPDLALFQHYLPDHLGLRLHGGEGVLRGHGVIDVSSLDVDLKLDADDADIAIDDYRFQSDVDVALLARTHAAAPEGIDVSGSYIRLFDARLANKHDDASDAWRAHIAVDQGRFSFPGRAKALDGRGMRLVQEHDLAELLAIADGELQLNGSVSDLAWLNQLMKNGYRVQITGSGDLQALLLLQGGWPAAGTEATVISDGLAVEILDYVAEGRGSVKLGLDEGGRRPDANIDVRLNEASFKRQNEERAFISHVELQLQAVARGLSYNGPTEDLTLRLYLPTARITDMSVYNLYLPEGFPLRLLSGQADLAADIELEPMKASGYVTLKTNSLRSRLDQQELSGDLTVNIHVADGEPRNMEFDISGSVLSLDNIKIAGDTESQGQPDWNARVEFTRANTVWRRPVRIVAEADLEMKDSTPIVAVLSNYRQKNGWIEKLLTVGPIKGEARMNMQRNQLVFPYAFANSDQIDVGAKGLIDEQTREGVIFARYRKLKGLLKIRDGKRNFDVIGARKSFDAYSPEASVK
jgi:hypothetical protein